MSRPAILILTELMMQLIWTMTTMVKKQQSNLKINLWSLTGIPDAEDPDDDNDGIPDIGKNIF